MTDIGKKKRKIRVEPEPVKEPAPDRAEPSKVPEPEPSTG